MKHRITAAQLQPGDKLSASGTEILSGPMVGSRTPAGKVEVAVRYRSGRETFQVWGAGTKMVVIREV